MAGLETQSEGELRKALADKRAKLQTFRFAVTGSKAKNVKEGRGLRKDIARLLTELRRRGARHKA